MRLLQPRCLRFLSLHTLQETPLYLETTSEQKQKLTNPSQTGTPSPQHTLTVPPTESPWS